MNIAPKLQVPKYCDVFPQEGQIRVSPHEIAMRKQITRCADSTADRRGVSWELQKAGSLVSHFAFGILASVFLCVFFS